MTFLFARFRQFLPTGFLAIVVAGVLAHQAGVTTRADQRLLDTAFDLSRRFFPQPVDKEPVIVGINEEFVQDIAEPLALNHVYLTKFLKAMGKSGAKVVGLDIDLPDKRYETLASVRDPQFDFHETLMRGLLEAIQSTTVVAARVWDEDRKRFHEIQLDYAFVLGQQQDVQALASAMFHRDSPDNRVRIYPRDRQPDRNNKLLSSEISKAMGISKDWSGLINYRLGERFKYIKLQHVLEWAEKNDINTLQQTFGGKAVLLGIVLADDDLLDVPVQLASWRGPEDHRTPGVLVHAQVLRSMWNQGFIKPAPAWALYLLCAVFAGFWFHKSIVGKLPLLMTASAAMLLLSAALFLNNIWLPPSVILLTGLLGFGARSILQSWQHFKDKQQLNRMFSGSVSPAVMQALIKGGLDSQKNNSRVAVCILFADIRNFTTMCEFMEAEEVVSLLNRYFARMVSVIHQHGGTVDKFIGDGLMAFFGAPINLECPEQNALEAARQMLQALETLNRELVAEGRAALQIGIGLHSGEAVVGHIGSEERHEYTAIGDAVNTASRVEGLCKETGYPIVCSDNVARAVGYQGGLIPLGEKALKGRAAMAVHGWQPQSGDAGSSAGEAERQEVSQKYANSH